MGTPEYEHIEDLYEGPHSTVRRCRRRSDGVEVVIKTLRPDGARPVDLARLRHHVEVTRTLDPDAVIRPLHFDETPDEGPPTLVMEGRKGIPVSDYLGSAAGGPGASAPSPTEAPLAPEAPLSPEASLSPEAPLSIETWLAIAQGLAAALVAIHRDGIVHKDIKPPHLLFDPERGQMWMLDFGIATTLPVERPVAPSIGAIAGTLAYMAPEQTGRMNRGIDHRADLYAAGVVLYQLATGQLPFTILDAVALVHAHLAVPARHPCELVPGFPRLLGDIIAKLLAKDPEDRYQSAAGLHADIARCAEEWHETGRIRPFPLAQRDEIARFQVPERLYGRERELATLTGAFERVASGHTELVLITGPSGIGKSALVNELYKPLVATRGFFVAGKFDQYRRNVPFSSLAHAFGGLVEELLDEPPEVLAHWHELLDTSLGRDARVIMDIVPALERLLGARPPAAELPPSAARHRLDLLFERFVRVFVTGGRPLVLFLDDLQWADLASLRLLQRLITDPEMKHLLIVSAYRDNEVGTGHPVARMLAEVEADSEAARGTLARVPLAPLDHAALRALIGDSLRRAPEQVDKLAELVAHKTGGAPFFTIQFLHTLADAGVFRYSLADQRWAFDLNKARALDPPDDVIELMLARLRKLPAEAQEVLMVAAALGGEFALSHLAAAVERAPDDIIEAMRQPIHEELVYPLQSSYEPLSSAGGDLEGRYRFFHDRIQQAAYLLIPRDRIAAIHLEIGRGLSALAQTEGAEVLEFDVVNHLNLGAALMDDDDERVALAEKNLAVGRQALEATAYDVATGYMNTGISLLRAVAAGPDERADRAEMWSRYYPLALALHLGAAEAEYLETRFERAQELVDDGLTHAHALLDRIQLLEVRLRLFMAQNRPGDAVDAGLEALAALGVELIHSPDEIALDEVLAKSELGPDMEVMRSPERLAAMRVLMNIGSPAFASRPDLFPKIPLTMVALSIRHGFCPESAYGMSLYGMIQCGILDRIAEGYRLGDFATKLIEHFDAREIACKVYLVHNVFIRHWSDHPDATLGPLARAIDEGLETGDVEYASYCAKDYCGHSLFSSLTLSAALDKQRGMLQILDKLRIDYSTMYGQVCHRLGQAFAGTIGAEGATADGVIGAALIDELVKANNLSTLFAAYVARLIHAVHFDSPAAAQAAVRSAAEYIEAATGWLLVGVFGFYRALAAVRGCAVGTGFEANPDAGDEVERCRAKLANWAQHAPAHYQHRLALVEAERHRVEGDIQAAMGGYERCIELAHASGLVGEEALAWERAGRFYAELGQPRVAALYLRGARDRYHAWGAHAKVAQLEAGPHIGPSDASAQQRHLGTVDVAPEQLDALALIKASQRLSRQIVLEELVDSLTRTALEHAGAQRGCLLLERDGQWLCVADVSATDTIGGVAHAGTEAPSRLPSSRPLDQVDTLPRSVIDRVRDRGELLVLDDEQLDAFVDDPYLEQAALRSLLCMPLRRQGQLAGVLYLEHRSAGRVFTAQRISTLEVLAAQAMISIDHAYLYRSLEHQVEARTRELRDTRQRLLDTARKAGRAEVTGNILHGVGNLLNSINVSVELLKEQLDDSRLTSLGRAFEILTNDPAAGGVDRARATELSRQLIVHLERAQRQQRAELDEVSERIDDMRRLMSHQRSLAYVAEELEPVVLHEVVADCVAHTRSGAALPYTSLPTNESVLPVLRTHRYKLTRILEQVLDNAIDAVAGLAPEQRHIEITATRSRRSTITLRICDNGCGVDDGARDLIFQAGYSTKPDHNGFGLHDAALNAAELGGRLQLEGPGVDKRTCFTLDLPAPT
ncbi:AAA family ATPase [Haliangium sp.]|uniref:AAA family ATPase n=1 Tax=Haliangium sp. TaxID=2663208 RepID=UPI003D0C2BA7